MVINYPEDNEVTAQDAGCWVDSARGIHMPSAIIERAEAFGYDLSNSLVKYLKETGDPEMGGSDRDELIDNYEWIHEEVDDAEQWMNEHVAPTGYSFGYHPDHGDWGLYSAMMWVQSLMDLQGTGPVALEDLLEWFANQYTKNAAVNFVYHGKPYWVFDILLDENRKGIPEIVDVGAVDWKGDDYHPTDITVEINVWKPNAEFVGRCHKAAGRQQSIAGHKTEEEWRRELVAQGAVFYGDAPNPEWAKINESLAGYFIARQGSPGEAEAKRTRDAMAKAMRKDGWTVWVEPRSVMGGSDTAEYPFSTMRKREVAAGRRIKTDYGREYDIVKATTWMKEHASFPFRIVLVKSYYTDGTFHECATFFQNRREDLSDKALDFYWGHYFPNPDDNEEFSLEQAEKEFLQRVIKAQRDHPDMRVIEGEAVGRRQKKWRSNVTGPFRTDGDKSQAFDVFLRGRLIGTVYFNETNTVEDIRKSLINDEGYDPRIVVVEAR